MLKKFKSRKFLLSLITMIVGIATALVPIGGKVGVIAGIVISAAAPITYVITEGIIDAKAVELASKATEEIVDKVKGGEHNE